MLRLVRSMFILLLLCSCAGGPRQKTAREYFAQQPQAVTEQEYRIQQGDTLDVKFFYNQELNEQLVVRPDGRISLQLIPEMVAAGQTPGQLAEQLTKAYASELRQPRVTVIVRSFTAHKVFVDGEVIRAGLVAMNGPMSVTQSISQAGGLKDSANLQEIIIIRRNQENKPVAFTVNVENALNGGDLGEDIALRPYDIVFVPKSSVGNLNTWIDLYLRKNIPVPIGFGYGF